MKKISVIIPIYNVELYIEECLKSVINQTLKDIEIICVNDGTPDNSMKIIQKYAKKDDRIVIINKENGGQSTARNAGLEVAKGKYIYFMDSDDYILEETLEELYDKLEENKLDIIYFDADSFYESEELKDEYKKFDNYYKRNPIYEEVVTGTEMFINMYENRDYRVSVCLQIIRKKLLDENNIKFIEGIIHEDEHYSTLLTLKAQRVMHVAKSYYQRRVRAGSTMTGTTSCKKSIGYFKSLLALISEINQVKDKKTFDYYYAYLNRLFSNTVDYLNGVDEQDIEKYKSYLTYTELAIFQLMVEKTYQNKKTINSLKEKLAKKQKKNKSLILLKKLAKKILFKYRKVSIKIKTKIKKNPLVSIIIPVYNCEDYLEEALNNLKDQKLKNIEIICIDDESTDNSLKILEKFAKEDKRFKVLKQKHSNAGNARNLGIKESSGEYLLFLDSDDIFSRNLCKLSFEEAVKYNADIVLFKAKKIDMKTNEITPIPGLLRRELLPNKKVFNAKDIPDKIFQLSTSAPWSKLYKAKFVKQNNLKYQSCPNSNDVFFTRTAFVTAKRITTLNKTLVNYRTNHGINTQAQKHKNPLAFYNAYMEVKKYLEAKKLYKKYESSFQNVVLVETVTNYMTTNSDESKKEILKKLKNGGAKEIGILDIDESTTYNKERYNQFKEMMK